MAVFSFFMAFWLSMFVSSLIRLAGSGDGFWLPTVVAAVFGIVTTIAFRVWWAPKPKRLRNGRFA